MKSLLVQGPYDIKTIKTLESLGVCQMAFDLRARSPNLIPTHHLKEFLKILKIEDVFLIFENDRKETIESFLDILKGPKKFTLIFRDQLMGNFYHELGHPFFWMFHPDGDWRTILSLPNCRGVLLPMKWQEEYRTMGLLWETIEARDLNVFIHAESFNEGLRLELSEEVKLSIDLTQEIEIGFRTVDQEKLKRMRIWSRDENSIS